LFFLDKREKEAGMTTPSYSIQYSFPLQEGQKIPLSAESHDYYGYYGLYPGYFGSLIPQNAPPAPENHAQQFRDKTYRQILQKLEESNLPWKNHVIDYLKHQYRRNLRVGTLIASRNSIKLFLRFLENSGRSISDLSRRDIEAYVENEQDRGLKPRSIKSRLASLYAFFSYLVKSGILPPEILQRKIRIKLPSSLPRAIESEHLEGVLSSISDVRDRAMIMLLLRTGMRIGELLALHATDVNLQEQKICIYIGEKNAQGRVVYFCDDAKDALMAWLRIRDPERRYLFYGYGDQPLSYARARLLFRRYVEKSGLAAKGYTLHQLRHTFATELLNAGMRLEVLQQLLGHSTIEMTRHYARLTDKTREEEYFRAMDRIEKEGPHGPY
jgi:integrase/recombinase XerD